MTNTKFRKRALLSSVAMLLVALVALGSATFAWFSTQNSATAETLSASTEKASDITLSQTGATGTFTHALVFATNVSGQYVSNQPLTPVTTKDFTDWYTANADDSNKGYSSAAATSVSATMNANAIYYKYAQLYVKSSVQQDVTITPNLGNATTDDKKILRMAFVPKATNNSTITEQKITKTIIWAEGQTLNDRANSSWSAQAETGTADPAFANGNDYVVNTSMTTALTISGVGADKVNAFDVYVWVEGTDFDCIDDNAGTTADITFSVTGSAQ